MNYGGELWSWADENWACLFQGGRYDHNSGLYNFRNRDYSPTLGRWMQQDPAGYVDGANLYEFVGDSPVDRTDPSGRSESEEEEDKLKSCYRDCEKLYMAGVVAALEIPDPIDAAVAMILAAKAYADCLDKCSAEAPRCYPPGKPLPPKEPPGGCPEGTYWDKTTHRCEKIPPSPQYPPPYGGPPIIPLPTH